MGSPHRIWAISAVHGETDRLTDLHDEIYNHIKPGDRLIYLGNYMGHGPRPCQTIDEILTFRRMVLAIPGMKVNDIVYLRGRQEDMWSRLLQIQFTPDPLQLLTWLLDNGMSSTLSSYGISPQDGVIAAHEGIMSLTKWTNRIREAMRRYPGHETFSTHWHRAAFTDTQQNSNSSPLLFVHSGVNPAIPLQDQGDNFLWAGENFNAINVPYNPFQKVIRGYDPTHGGLNLNCVTATIDGGCGFGGSLICAGFDSRGDIFELYEA